MGRKGTGPPVHGERAGPTFGWVSVLPVSPSLGLRERTRRRLRLRSRSGLVIMTELSGRGVAKRAAAPVFPVVAGGRARFHRANGRGSRGRTSSISMIPDRAAGVNGIHVARGWDCANVCKRGSGGTYLRRSGLKVAKAEDARRGLPRGPARPPGRGGLIGLTEARSGARRFKPVPPGEGFGRLASLPCSTSRRVMPLYQKGWSPSGYQESQCDYESNRKIRIRPKPLATDANDRGYGKQSHEQGSER